MDVPWKYLNFFLEDDEKLAEIGREYSSGRMLTGEIKAELVKVCKHAILQYTIQLGHKRWLCLAPLPPPQKGHGNHEQQDLSSQGPACRCSPSS